MSKIWQNNHTPNCPQMQAIKEHLRTKRLPAPDQATMDRIAAAGKGEHQDRLFTLAVESSISQWMNRLEVLVEEHNEAHKEEKVPGIDEIKASLLDTKGLFN